MATSATIKTNVSYDSYFWVKWERSSADIENNRTKIYWSCGVYCGHEFYSNAIKMSAVTINGAKVFSGKTCSNFKIGDHRIASGYLNIAHNSDGSKTFSVSAFTGWLYSDHKYSASAERFALPSIARASSLTASNGTLGVEQTLKINRKSTSFRHILRRTVGSSDTNVLIGKSQDAVSHAWSPSKSWAQYNTTGKTIACKLELETYTSSSATSPIGTVSKNITLTIPEDDDTKPAVSIVVAPVNPSSFSAALTGLYIQGKSKAKVICTASPKYNATISEYTVKAGAQSQKGSFSTLTTDYLRAEGSVPVTAKVKDSRGFYGQTAAVTNITVLPYTKPSIAPVEGQSKLICERCDADGEFSNSGTHLRILARAIYSGLDGNNTCVIQYRYKAETGSWSNWADLADSNGAVNANLDLGLSAQSAYTIELRAVDLVECSVSFTFKIPTDIVNLHLRAGKGVAIGRYSAGEDRLDVAFDSFFERRVFINSSKAVTENDLKSTSLTLSVYDSSLTDFSYTAKYVPTIPAVFVRFYGVINKDLTIQTGGHNIIGFPDSFLAQYKPNYLTALSVYSSKEIKLVAKSDGIYLNTTDKGLKSYAVWGAGFWFV